MMDDEERSILLKTYREYHLGEVGVTEELLVEQGRAWLSSLSVPPENRFLSLDIDAYRNVLGNIAEKLENTEDSINKMKAGFNSLEKYAVNLWKFPWRKEYHSIKLYTASFKWNVQNQLQDLDTILFILKSLGYNKTKQHQDQVTVKEPDLERAIWVSLDLFLIQLDLQIIKEIMENFTDSRLKLKHIVKTRSRTYDVKDACKYLSTSLAKRQKVEAPQESEVASHRQVPSGKINSTRDDKHAVAHAVQSTRSDSKGFIVANTTEATVMDTDDSSSGSLGSKEDPSADTPTNNKDDLSRRRVVKPAQFGDDYSDHDLYGLDPAGNQPGGTRRNRFDVHGSGSHSLSYLGTITQSRHGHQHSTQSYANLKGGGLQGINVDTQRYPVQPGTRITAGTTATRLDGSSGSDRYDNWRDLRSSTFHPRRADTTSPNYTSAVAGHRETSVPEPMEVEQTGRSQEMQNNFTALPNGMAEGVHARRATRSGVGDLNTTLEHRLTLAPNTVSSADKTSQRFSDVSKEERKPYDSQKYTSEKDATQFQDRATREYSSKSSLQINNNLTSESEAARNFRGHMGERTDAKNTSSVPSGRDLHHMPSAAQGDATSSHQRAAEVQYPAHSSRNDLCTGGASNGMMSPEAGKTLQKDPTAICDMCQSEGTSICKNCHLSVCGKCNNFYRTDLCSKTKGQHYFEEFKETVLQQRSADVEALSGQHAANVHEGMVDDGKEWSCSRCTYLNPPDYKICAMCAKSRGFTSVDPTESGSRVCRNCTFHNKASTTVCEACHKTLALRPPETAV